MPVSRATSPRAKVGTEQPTSGYRHQEHAIGPWPSYRAPESERAAPRGARHEPRGRARGAGAARY